MMLVSTCVLNGKSHSFYIMGKSIIVEQRNKPVGVMGDKE